MRPDTEITEKDVIRLFSNEISDLNEIDRIFEAIEASPYLQFVATVFDETELDKDESNTTLPPMKFRDLRYTRLCRLVPKAEITNILNLEQFETEVEYEADGLIKTFSLTMTKTEENHFSLKADWPAGLEPIGFVLADFDLARERTPFEADIILPQKPLTRPASHIEAPTTREDRVLAANSWVMRGDSGAKCDADAAGKKEVAENGDTSHFCVARDVDDNKVLILENGALEVTANIGDRSDDIVFVELFDNPIADNSTDDEPSFSIPVYVSHKKGDLSATGLLKDFPVSETSHKEGSIRVRALEYADLPRLNGEMVTTVLGGEESKVTVPISDTYIAEFDVDYEGELIKRSNTAWFLRMAEQGGAV